MAGGGVSAARSIGAEGGGGGSGGAAPDDGRRLDEAAAAARCAGTCAGSGWVSAGVQQVPAAAAIPHDASRGSPRHGWSTRPSACVEAAIERSARQQQRAASPCLGSSGGGEPGGGPSAAAAAASTTATGATARPRSAQPWLRGAPPSTSSWQTPNPSLVVVQPPRAYAEADSKAAAARTEVAAAAAAAVAATTAAPGKVVTGAAFPQRRQPQQQQQRPSSARPSRPVGGPAASSGASGVDFSRMSRADRRAHVLSLIYQHQQKALTTSR